MPCQSHMYHMYVGIVHYSNWGIAHLQVNFFNPDTEKTDLRNDVVKTMDSTKNMVLTCFNLFTLWWFTFEIGHVKTWLRSSMANNFHGYVELPGWLVHDALLMCFFPMSGWTDTNQLPWSVILHSYGTLVAHWVWLFTEYSNGEPPQRLLLDNQVR